MDSVLRPYSPTKRRANPQQRRYLHARKTDRPQIVKHEKSVQDELRKWFVDNFPGEHFISDTGAGAFNSRYAKEQHNRQQSHKHEPDVKILAARRGYHGLLLELKADGFELHMKRDGRKIRVYKDSRGRIIDRDYKIRKKGDWVSLHVEQQAKVLEDYNKKGYCGKFAVGLEVAKKWICWYFDVPYIEPTTLF